MNAFPDARHCVFGLRRRLLLYLEPDPSRVFAGPSCVAISSAPGSEGRDLSTTSQEALHLLPGACQSLS